MALILSQVAQEYWCKVSECRQMRAERVTEAQSAAQEALAKLEKFLSLISEAREDVLTRSNPCLNRYDSWPIQYCKCRGK